MTTTTIPYNKLFAWDGNVRKTGSKKGIADLAASIAAHGLLQSLVVRKDRHGKYAVIAGRRRLLAIKALVDAKTLQPDMPIPCTVIGSDADATEIGLAENVRREAMHPADEFEAFRDLTLGGMPVADVAARFGVSETVVKQRMKLADVSPKLISAYRKGEMTLQHVMAFTVSDDHAEQERVWSSLPESQKDDPSIIRNCLGFDRKPHGAQVRCTECCNPRSSGSGAGVARRETGADGVLQHPAWRRRPADHAACRFVPSRRRLSRLCRDRGCPRALEVPPARGKRSASQLVLHAEDCHLAGSSHLLRRTDCKRCPAQRRALHEPAHGTSASGGIVAHLWIEADLL